jgi:hypothetical protein
MTRVARKPGCRGFRKDTRRVRLDAAELTVEHTGEPPGGRFARYVTVESNNVDDPTVAVIVQGEVILEFTVEPAELDFGEAVAGQGAAASLRLTRNFGDRLLLGPLGYSRRGWRSSQRTSRQRTSGSRSRSSLLWLQTCRQAPTRQNCACPSTGSSIRTLWCRCTRDPWRGPRHGRSIGLLNPVLPAA